MADLSKLRFNGTDYNVKDASAPLRKFTNYSKTGNLPITSDDTTQTAIGKLEKALDDKISTSAKGAASGVAELDANGKVPSSQLPSYVDDVLEYSAKISFPATGETGKIYVDTNTNKTYRWSGSAYVEISESLALGETSSTAYRGDRGKAAYDHSQITNGNPHGTTGANTKLTGYSKGSSKDAVAATDTINAAIAKHENRIDTNQSNILYALNTGVKNLLDTSIEKIKKLNENWTWDGNVGTYANATVKIGSDGIRLSANNAGSNVNFYLLNTYFEEDKWIIGNTYHISGVPSNSGLSTYHLDLNRGFPNYTNVYQNIVNQDITVPVEEYDMRLRIVVVNGATFSETHIPLMLSLPNVYEAAPNYQSFSRTNTVLTILESQDRDELIDLVDNGDKNIFPIQTLVPYGPGLSNNSNLTCTNNGDGTYTLNGSTTAAGTIHLCDAIYSNTYGGYYMSGCPSDLNSASEEKARLALYTAVGSSGVAYETGDGVLIPSTFDQCYLAIYVFANKTYNNAIFKPMFCTKAKYIISPKYVPHVENKTYKGIGIVNSGSLNSVTESCFAAYSSNVTDGPIPNQWMFCRTTILDAPSALQEVTTIGVGFESYIRVKSNNEWRAWKKITTTTP